MTMTKEQDDNWRKDIIFKAQMDLASYEFGPQEPWVKEWTRKVLFAKSNNDALRTGQHLYLLLPSEFQVELTSTIHDPFYGELRKDEIQQWFIRHITFDDEGRMAILRNYEQALWGRQDWSK